MGTPFRFALACAFVVLAALSAGAAMVSSIPVPIPENYIKHDATLQGANGQLGIAPGADTRYLFRSNNLSDLANAATARGNLGVTASGADTGYLWRSNNLSDLGNASTARTNLGLAAVASSGSASDLSNGTLANARLAGSGATTVNGQTCTLGSTCTVTHKSAMLGGVNATQAAGATSYYPCQGFPNSSALTEANAGQPSPMAGTIRNLYVSLSTAPGTGNSVTVTLRVGSASPGSGPTCTISNSATTCNDTADSAAITAGQACDVQVVFSASATAARVFYGQELDI